MDIYRQLKGSARTQKVPPPPPQDLKSQINKLNHIETKNFCPSNNTIKRVKRQTVLGKKMLTKEL